MRNTLVAVVIRQNGGRADFESILRQSAVDTIALIIVVVIVIMTSSTNRCDRAGGQLTETETPHPPPSQGGAGRLGPTDPTEHPL